jgi:hypothetical protein
MAAQIPEIMDGSCNPVKSIGLIRRQFEEIKGGEMLLS